MAVINLLVVGPSHALTGLVSTKTSRLGFVLKLSHRRGGTSYRCLINAKGKCWLEVLAYK